MDDWRRFAQQMASLARDLLSQESLHDTLDRITASATELVEDCDAAASSSCGAPRCSPWPPPNRW